MIDRNDLIKNKNSLHLDPHYVRFNRDLNDDVEYLYDKTTTTQPLQHAILDLRKRMIAQLQSEWRVAVECAGEILPQLVVDKVQLEQYRIYSIFVHAYLPQGADPVKFLQETLFDAGGLSGEFLVLQEK
jgi:hypothetical protein